MRKFVLSLLLLLAVAGTQAQQQLRVVVSKQIEERNGKQYYIHTVQKGQTVYSIAKAYNVSVDEIYFENPGTENGIGIGQQLWIPTVSREEEVKQELKTASFDFFYHIVAKGETLNKIAGLYGVGLAALRQANPDLREPLMKGQYIKIPVNGAGSDDPPVSFDPSIPVIADFRHTVAAGESLESIAKKYGTTPQRIRAVNAGLGSHPQTGTRLRIPQEKVTTQKPEKKKTEFVRHKVKKKETLYSIAREYGVTVDDIYDANPDLTYRIKPGQIIRIPRTTIADTYIVHKITKYTKLNKVAKLYKISTQDILALNPSLGNKLYAGQTVKIPVGNKAKKLAESNKAQPAEVKPAKGSPESAPGFSRCNKQKPNKNKVFRVALMVPLFLEETDSLDVDRFLASPHDNFKPFRFIQFYEGALMAIDSLRQQGMKVKLTVYDVDKSITKTTKVLQNPELRNADLIIGPFYQQSFHQVALFAGNFNIPIVNPVSFRNEIVKKYRTVVKMKPGTRYQPDMVMTLVRKYYPDAKVFLVSQSAYQSSNAVEAIRQKLEKAIPAQVRISNTDIYNLAVAVAHRDEDFRDGDRIPAYKLEGKSMDPERMAAQLTDSTVFDNSVTQINFMKQGIDPFLQTANPLRTNLVVIYGENKAFVMDVMNKLNEQRDSLHVKIIGMPSWERFSNLDETQCNNMDLIYFSSTFTDYENPQTEKFIRHFGRRYGTEPDKYGFTGFDATYRILSALFVYDKDLLRCLPKKPVEGLQGFYRFEKSGTAKNLENVYWNTLRYNNYRLEKLPDPVPLIK